MISYKKLYTISFIEGASVMAVEIAGAKLLAPFFGSSLYVWSSVMAITLGGLASGYFLGGKLSKRKDKERMLFYILAIAVCCMSSMPFLNSLLYSAANYLSLLPAVVISTFVLLFPTMLCMGATSPLIISVLTTQVNDSGENSGKIYAISTTGGILATFLSGFYLIPNYGITFTLLCFSVLLALVSLFLLVKKKSFSVLIILIPLVFLGYGFIKKRQNLFTIYQTDGILGKLEIRDEPSVADPQVLIRKLLINSIIQTEMNLSNQQSVSEYIHLLEKNIIYFPKGKALILGLGGGLVSNVFHQYHYQVTGVEFDERIIKMAKTFFYLNDSVKTVCDDARHFINTDNSKYNIVLFDIFKAEEQPSHVITMESLEKLKLLLDSNGVVLINTHGYLKGEKGKGTQCLLATLKQAGFSLKICTPSENEDYRNLLIVASVKSLTATLHNEIQPLIFTNTQLINTDNKPVLEKLNAQANQSWRSNYLHNYILN